MAEHKPTEVNDASPTSLNRLVGQRSVTEQVRVALDAAQQDGKPFDHALLVGPPGCGKTQTAKVIAAEMANDLHELLGQSITSPADFNSVLLAAKDGDIVFVDEAHELDKVYQTALFLARDQRKLVVGGGRSGRAGPCRTSRLGTSPYYWRRPTSTACSPRCSSGCGSSCGSTSTGSRN